MRHASCDAQSLLWCELAARVEQQRRQAEGELARIAAALIMSVALVAAGMVAVPAFSYTVTNNAAATSSASSPEAAVADLLNRTGRLPIRGSQIALRGDHIVWAASGDGDAMPRQRVVRFHIRQVQVSSSAPVLWSVLSRSPTSQARVEAEVETADGQRAMLTFVLWQYRLLLPGTRTLSDNGAWMPERVYWP